jgi:hypothetical protein
VCLSECAVGKAEVVGDGSEFGPEGLEYFGGGEGVLSSPVRRRFVRVAGMLESRDDLIASLDVRPDRLSQ